MSINREMSVYRLQKKSVTSTESGSNKETWIAAGTIRAAIHRKDELRMTANERYREATHTGLTHRKDLTAFSYRIVDGSTIYSITSCNTEGRLTNLLLKVVDGNA